MTVDKAGKVFARLLGEAAQGGARSPRRRPQTAKTPFRRFLFAKLFLCAYMVKEKALFGIVLFGGNTFYLQPDVPAEAAGRLVLRGYRFILKAKNKSEPVSVCETVRICLFW